MAAKPKRAAAAKRKPQPAIDAATRLKLYRTMVECRQLEKRAHDLFMQNLIKGTSHLALGQEAVAAGFGVAMREDDYTFCTYRGHNHTYVRGVSMTAILGELMGNSAGLMRGKGGSMHLTSIDHGAMGSYAIIGAHLPIAAGAAWSAQYRGTEQVAVCFFGDGTTNIGAFHEALNFAVIWKLPVVFVCENNLYMEYTSIYDVTAVKNPAADRASAYGLEPILIDGNDVDVVYRTAVDALELAQKRRRAEPDRGRDLPPRRPFEGRSRQVPPRRRGPGVARQGPGPDIPRAAARPQDRREGSEKDRRGNARYDRRSHGDRAQRAAA